MRKADIQVGPRHGKRHFRKISRWAAKLLVGLCCLFEQPVIAQVGATFETLDVKGTVYRAVKVLSVSPSTITIRHSEGVSQVAFRSLSPELQRQLGYNPAEEELHELLLATEKKQQLRQTARIARSGERATRPGSKLSDSPVGRALARFGTAPTVAPMDLRPRYRELELGTKNQGLRPSCAVFAVVSALEFQNAAAAGHAEKLSEEYLIWAVRRTLGIPAGEKRRFSNGTGADEEDERDAGFSLDEVLSAVRAYGVPLQSELPNTFGLGMENIPEPGESVIASARERREVSTYMVPGVNNEVKIANIMHALNEGVPVVVSLRWPHWRSLRAPTLSEQAPMEGYSHAVTVVGYLCETGNPEDVRFIFKNSWGVRWGVGGYGFAERRYLRRHLLNAVVIEVRASAR